MQDASPAVVPDERRLRGFKIHLHHSSEAGRGQHGPHWHWRADDGTESSGFVSKHRGRQVLHLLLGKHTVREHHQRALRDAHSILGRHKLIKP